MSVHTASPRISSTAVMLAVDRLSVSRTNLRQALIPPPHARDTGGGAARPTLGRWLDHLARTPAVSVLIDGMRRWWAKQPVRLALLLADDAAETLMQPVVQKHPYRLVLGAAAMGALLVLSRPWRWLPRAALTSGLGSALMAGLLPTLINQAVAPASDKPWRAHSQ